MRRLAVLVALGAAAAAAFVVARARNPADAVHSNRIDEDTMRLVPDSVRVKVELLNASGERGLARDAMHYFRARGFDVVLVGNASERLDSTLVLDRSGHPAWAALAARAAGGARVEARPDSSRYLDLSILLGRSFRAPPQIFDP